MKKILILFSTLLLLACGGENGGANTPAPTNEFLNVSDITIAGEEETATLTIQASPNCQWIITCDQSWVRNINPATGRGNQSVTITVEKNPSSTSPRPAALSVSNTSQTIQKGCTLTQLASKSYLTLSVEGSQQNIPSAGGELKVTVTSNSHWEIEGVPSWLSVTPTSGDNNGVVTITASANTTKDERPAMLIFRPTNGTPQQLSIRQLAAALPTIQLPQVTGITKNEATVSFSFTSELAVTQCGVYYSTVDDENYASHQYESQTWNSTQGRPTIQLKDLSSGTTYYIHASATCSAGIGYSGKVSFTTESSVPGIGDNLRPE